MFWLLLPVCLDSEGRGQDSIQWLRSKLFPIREDDVSQQIAEIMDWLANRGMIIRYEVEGRKYFYSANFKKYQSGTDKEAPSYLPAPIEVEKVTPDLLQTSSGVGQELVRVNAMQGNAIQDNASAREKIGLPPSSDYVMRVISKVTGLVSITDDTEKVIPALEGLYYQHGKDENALVEYLKPFYQEWITRKGKDGRRYKRTNFAWLYQWAVGGEIPGASTNSKGGFIPTEYIT